MNQTVVVFQSKYGATRKYAEWIAAELNCDLFERKDVKPAMLMPYRTIIYGGGLYAGGVSGIDLLTKSFDQLSDKNLILFTCGLADPLDQTNVDSIIQSVHKVFTSEMREKIKLFHVCGAIDYAKLGPVHKTMMAMLYRMMAKKDDSSLRNEDREMLATYGKAVDFTDKSMALPLIDYVKALSNI